MPRRPVPRRQRDQRIGVLEIVCVLLVLLAIAALIAWIVTNAGGGHNLT
jgi:hypothetical protein